MKTPYAEAYPWLLAGDIAEVCLKNILCFACSLIYRFK